LYFMSASKEIQSEKKKKERKDNQLKAVDG
jgi:hypothetical protein